MIVRKRDWNVFLDIWDIIVLQTVWTFKIILIDRSEIHYGQACIVSLYIPSIRLIQLHIALKDLLLIMSDWIIIVEHLRNKVVQRIALGKTVSTLFFLIRDIVRQAFVQNDRFIACFLRGTLFRHKKTSRGNCVCERYIMSWGKRKLKLLRIKSWMIILGGFNQGKIS